MTASLITERLARLKESSNKSMTSEDRTPTPLWAFIKIYEKASHTCYINYMEGAKLLAKYLAPIETPELDESYIVPDLLSSYETQELAKILNINQDIIIQSVIENRYKSNE